MQKRWPALFTLTVALVLTACGGSDGDQATIKPTFEIASTPAATTTPDADNDSQFIGGIEVLPFTVGDEVELPDGLALIIEVGCMECHCPCINGLVRVHRDTSGEFRIEELFAGNIAGVFAFDDDASEIVIARCSRGYCGPVEPASEDAQTTLSRSLDGGVTWEDVDVLVGAHAVIATTQEGILLNGPHDPEQQAPSGYWLYPSGDSIQPPAEADGNRVISLPDGRLVWKTNAGGFVGNDGSDFLAFDDVRDIAPDYTGDGLVIEWTGPQEEQLIDGFGSQSFLTIARKDGSLLKTFSSPGGPLVFGGWINSSQAIGNAYIIPPGAEFNPGFWQPVIFDFDSATIHPIAMPNAAKDFTQPALFRKVLALVQGNSD